MPEYITVKPAYNISLNSEKEVLQHYLEGRDFIILSLFHGFGSYLNLLDCERSKKPITLEVRFGKKGQKVTLLDTTNPQGIQKKLEWKLRQASRNGKEN